MTASQLNVLLGDSDCPLPPARVLPPSPATLAQRVVKTLPLPKPSGHRSPSETMLYQGYPFTWVNLYTFYWTDPTTWHPLSVTARAGSSWATVTATPVQLNYTPGDGSPTVTCPGPGRPWQTSDGNNPPTDGACAYQYRDLSGPGPNNPFTSTQSITWQVSWIGAGDATGSFGTWTTQTTGQLNVMQIQIVNCDPHTAGSCH